MPSKIYQFDPCKPDFLTNLSTVKFNDDQVKLPDKNRGFVSNYVNLSPVQNESCKMLKMEGLWTVHFKLTTAPSGPAANVNRPSTFAKRSLDFIWAVKSTQYGPPNLTVHFKLPVLDWYQIWAFHKRAVTWSVTWHVTWSHLLVKPRILNRKRF